MKHLLKFLPKKGVKQVIQVTSSERGELVTLCCIINAIGNALSPFFIFLCVNFQEKILISAPVGAEGAVSALGGMNSSIFFNGNEAFHKTFKINSTKLKASLNGQS